jgi:hypothetical protein
MTTDGLAKAIHEWIIVHAKQQAMPHPVWVVNAAALIDFIYATSEVVKPNVTIKTDEHTRPTVPSIAEIIQECSA